MLDVDGITEIYRSLKQKEEERDIIYGPYYYHHAPTEFVLFFFFSFSHCGSPIFDGRDVPSGSSRSGEVAGYYIVIAHAGNTSLSAVTQFPPTRLKHAASQVTAS